MNTRGTDFVNASKRTLVSVTHTDDHERWTGRARPPIAAGTPFALEYRVVHADGGVRWVPRARREGHRTAIGCTV